jgi:hypothetical protein
MFIKRLDYISPPVTFYFQGYLSHASIISGIISIISICFMLSLTIYFSLDLIKRNDPNVFSYNSFTKDAGIFPIKSSGIFHFISIGTILDNLEINGVNFTDFRIIGFEESSENYLKDRDLFGRNHWLYGLCNNKSDTEGIGYLIDYSFFEKSACIRKYYSAEDKKYYDTSEPKFRWPEITCGTYCKKYKIYSIVVEKCKEESLNEILGGGKQCRNFYDSDDKIRPLYGIIKFFFVNQYIDVLNYENPHIKFIYLVEGVISQNSYTNNNLNFNPTLVKTHNGLIFDHIEESTGYLFERNDVVNANVNNNEYFTTYTFWLKNIMNYNVRTYKRIQDVISNIGGICQFIIVASICVNSLFNNYIILSDTENLLNSSIYKAKTFNNIKMESFKKKLNGEIKKEDINQPNNKRKINTEKSLNKTEDIKNDKTYSTNNCMTSHEHIDINKIKMENELNKENQRSSLIKRRKEKNFCNFLLFKFSCRKTDNIFQIYNNFRIKMISEEHLIKNHLDIYNLLRVTEKRRKHRRNSYELKDLINLV